jgi:lincosamide nucleotidyltransferase
MATKEALLRRLDAIGETLSRKDGALALLGLGSVGIELGRIDDYSDLDFFCIVAQGHKMRFIERLDWLEETHPLAYSFMNSDVGCKILFDDGIYGEYAVFEEQELADCDYSEGRIVWHAAVFPIEGISKPKKASPRLKARSLDYAFNEALTNLYVGLGRYARGEKLSAFKFVQGFAVDSIVSALNLLDKEIDYYPDRFGNERRLERRYPAFAGELAGMIQGYDKVPESAVHILNFLEQHYPVNERMGEEIRRLARL